MILPSPVKLYLFFWFFWTTTICYMSLVCVVGKEYGRDDTLKIWFWKTNLSKLAKLGLLVYICSGIGSLLFAPLNISLLYILFFGSYGLVKGFIERLNKTFIEIVLKLVFFNISFAICLFLMKLILGIDLQAIFANLLSRLASFGLNLTQWGILR